MATKLDQILSTLRKQPNLTLAEVGREVGVCRQRVSFLLRQANLSKGRRSRKLEYYEIEIGISEGKNVAELAKQYNVSKSTIYAMLQSPELAGLVKIKRKNMLTQRKG